MSLEEAITRSEKLRATWGMDIHVMNDTPEGEENFERGYFCVLDINLYIYTRHNYSKNHKVYHSTSQIIFELKKLFA